MNTTACRRNWFWRWPVITMLCVFSMSGVGFAQTILYVDDDAPGGGDGLTWDTAFNDLQHALDVKVTGAVEIRVGQGTYVPSLRTDPKDPRSATFRLANDTILLGGFAGVGESDPEQRDWEKFQSILSADLNGDDQPNFVNNSENAYHAVVAEGLSNTATLNGFVVAGGNANVGSWPTTTSAGAGVLILNGGANILRCKFQGNYAEAGGGVYGRWVDDVVVDECVFIGNEADDVAGALRFRERSTATIKNCSFVQNFCPVAGALGVADCTAVISNCTFTENHCVANGGALRAEACVAEIHDCTFTDNSAQYAGGAIAVSDTGIHVERCTFVGNTADWFGGALLVNATQTTFIKNCLLHSNTADDGGAIFLAGHLEVFCSTLSWNSQAAIRIFEGVNGASLKVANSILWGNTPAQIDHHDGGPPRSMILEQVDNSNIQGGWSGLGSNNINANPLFVQPGCGNFRLAKDSPCIDAGDNDAIPDGITTDLDGNPRIINAIVDMGAYEGEHEMLPPAACESDIDEGEFVHLTPQGGPFNPVLKPTISISNDSTQNDAYATVTQFESQLHSGAGGFNELGDKLALETSLIPGAYFSRVYINFDQSNLNGFDPLDLDLTYFNATSGAYELAAASNIQNSPDHKGPLGDRHVTVSTTWQTALNFEIGDYGVFWNPDQQKGFAWANVDHASDFAFGIPLPACIGDCTYPSDGMVDVADLTLVLDNWGMTPAGPASFADITNNGIVDVDDLVTLINAWGACK